jgi:hypothetical protein
MIINKLYKVYVILGAQHVNIVVGMSAILPHVYALSFKLIACLTSLTTPGLIEVLM